MSNSPRVPSLAGVAARAPQPAVVDRPAKIEAERLNFYYGGTRALQDISVRLGDRVSRGQRIAKIEDFELQEQVKQAP